MKTKKYKKEKAFEEMPKFENYSFYFPITFLYITLSP
jgi:hypothetical protein